MKILYLGDQELHWLLPKDSIKTSTSFGEDQSSRLELTSRVDNFSTF